MPIIVPLKLGDDKMDEIAGYLLNKFELSVQARSNQVDGKYKRWQDNYAGKPQVEVRSTPFQNASNFVPQLIRMHTDILSARLCGIVFATKPFWKPKTWLKSLPHECMDTLSEWLEYKSFSELEIFELIDTAIFQASKTGTVILKAPWVDQTFITMDKQGNPSRNDQSGLIPRTIAFDDFFPFPITARNLSETLIKFHRLRFAKEEVEWKKANTLWAPASCDSLLRSPDTEESSAKRETEAMEAGISLTEDVDRPFNAIEAWFDYPLDGQNNHKLIVTFNPKMRGKESILRAIYNYHPEGMDDFVDFRLMKRDDLFYGYSIPEILEESQEEQAQIHNSRRDSNTIANVPAWKKRMYGNVPNPSNSWYPGRVFELENMDDLDVLQFGGNYNSMIDEEQYLLQLAERYTGIGTPMQGFGAGAMEGKRGIYNSGGTLALLAEGNKRLDIFLKRMRAPFHRLGNLIFHSYRDFGGDALETEFAAFGPGGENLRKIFTTIEPRNYRGLFFDIGASDSGTNRELDRQNLLLMANTMASYYRQMVEACTTATQLPQGHPLQNILFEVLDGAKDLADRLLFAFEIGDRKRLLPDVREILGGEQGRPGLPNAPGVPGAEESVGVGDLQTLSQSIAAITSGGAGPNGGIQ